MRSAWVQLGVSLAVTIALLVVVDGALSEHGTAGPEREIVRSTMERVAKNRDARIFTFGCSTRLNDRALSRALGVPKETIVDGHMGGCHQGCSYAELRALLREGRHFERAFFTYNLFESCEHDHSKRTLQQQMLLPVDETPALFGHYLHAQHPFRLIGRALFSSASGAYADSNDVRRRASAWLFGKEDAKKVPRLAFATVPAAAPWMPSCTYEDDEITLKTSFTDAILDDMTKVADHAYLVIVPDRTLFVPEHAERWVKYREGARAFIARHPEITLIDLTDPKDLSWDHFRDGVHLNARGFAVVEARLADLLAPLRREGAAP